MKDITIGDETISAPIDAGRSVSFLHEDISTDILEQASLSFTEDGVEIHNYERKNYQDLKESICPEEKGSFQEIKSVNQGT
ncbi:hypothetical protein NPIL_287501 [Nephila pilipes]|uniref:Uncharacterized protein n=1 Tax=Nephila pilipes TaxID=299642 RepID=A0A8X6PBM0_NEPPI|nr:hypothetical protein NPIL_287501 [Nephila pilipes]